MTPTPLTTEQIAELRRLMAEATPGPWFWIDSYTVTNEAHDSVTGNIYSRQLITLAVNALPDLLDAAEREAILRKALRGQLFGVPHRIDVCTCNRCEMLRAAALAEGGGK
jgi:hypothetical protein